MMMLEIPRIAPAAGPEAIAAALRNMPDHSIACDTWHPTDNVPKVLFRAAHSGDALYLQYRVEEPEVRAEARFDGDRVWEDSCVECFLSPDGDDFYYNFEFSAAGYLYLHGGRPGDRIAPTPEVFASVGRWSSYQGERAADGLYHWQMIAKIPVTALFRHALSSWEGLRVRANFYKCGDLLPHPHFLSWSAIDLPKPAFHCPEFFGDVRFL